MMYLGAPSFVWFVAPWMFFACGDAPPAAHGGVVTEIANCIPEGYELAPDELLVVAPPSEDERTLVVGRGEDATTVPLPRAGLVSVPGAGLGPHTLTIVIRPTRWFNRLSTTIDAWGPVVCLHEHEYPGPHVSFGREDVPTTIEGRVEGLEPGQSLLVHVVLEGTDPPSLAEETNAEFRFTLEERVKPGPAPLWVVASAWRHDAIERVGATLVSDRFSGGGLTFDDVVVDLEPLDGTLEVTVTGIENPKEEVRVDFGLVLGLGRVFSFWPATRRALPADGRMQWRVPSASSSLARLTGRVSVYTSGQSAWLDLESGLEGAFEITLPPVLGVRSALDVEPSDFDSELLLQGGECPGVLWTVTLPPGSTGFVPFDFPASLDAETLPYGELSSVELTQRRRVDGGSLGTRRSGSYRRHGTAPCAGTVPEWAVGAFAGIALDGTCPATDLSVKVDQCGRFASDHIDLDHIASRCAQLVPTDDSDVVQAVGASIRLVREGRLFRGHPVVLVEGQNSHEALAKIDDAPAVAFPVELRGEFHGVDADGHSFGAWLDDSGGYLDWQGDGWYARVRRGALRSWSGTSGTIGLTNTYGICQDSDAIATIHSTGSESFEVRTVNDEAERTISFTAVSD